MDGIRKDGGICVNPCWHEVEITDFPKHATGLPAPATPASSGQQKVSRPHSEQKLQTTRTSQRRSRLHGHELTFERKPTPMSERNRSRSLPRGHDVGRINLHRPTVWKPNCKLDKSNSQCIGHSSQFGRQVIAEDSGLVRKAVQMEAIHQRAEGIHDGIENHQAHARSQTRQRHRTVVYAINQLLSLSEDAKATANASNECSAV